MFTLSKLNRTKLRIKNRHLSEEVRIIKHELRRKDMRKNPDARGQIEGHLDLKVRTEVRATQLAIAFLKGKDYNSVESKVNDISFLRLYVIPRVASMVYNYASCKDHSIFDSVPSYMDWKKRNPEHNSYNSMGYMKFVETQKKNIIKTEFIEKWMGL